VSEYAIQGGRAGKTRLDLLGQIYDPCTSGLLDDLGVPEGGSALDVGCGGGNVTGQVARRIGPSGRVVGIDFDLELLELARLDAKTAGIENVEFRAGDARAPEGGPYDLITARFLLMHLAEPEQVLAALVGVLRPGGRLVIEDTDFTGLFTIPTVPSFVRGVEVYRETLRRAGGDADIAQRLPHLLRDAGLVDRTLNVIQPIVNGGEQAQLFPNTLAMMTPRIVERGVMSAPDLAVLVDELVEVLAGPEIAVGLPRIAQVSGCAPLSPEK
jgi:SAM-dependent methyltransferase